METFWKHGAHCYYARGIVLQMGIFCGYTKEGKALVFPTYPNQNEVTIKTPGGCETTGLACIQLDVEELYHSVWDLIESLITELRGNLQGQLLNIPFNTPACINCKHCNPATDESEPILKCDLPGGPRPIREHTLTCNKFKLRDNLKKKQEGIFQGGIKKMSKAIGNPRVYWIRMEMASHQKADAAHAEALSVLHDAYLAKGVAKAEMITDRDLIKLAAQSVVDAIQSLNEIEEEEKSSTAEVRTAPLADEGEEHDRTCRRCKHSHPCISPISGKAIAQCKIDLIGRFPGTPACDKFELEEKA